MAYVIRDIARNFLPLRQHYYYARIKLATDPLYRGVAAALDGCNEPLLDLGCGIGLLAHALRALGFTADYFGVDIDMDKIIAARAACARAKLPCVHFGPADLAQGFPAHRGSVTLLDVLQFLPPTAHTSLLDAAIDCLTPTSRLIIRTGLHRQGWRLRVTRAVDRFSRWARWMNTGPQRYPRREELEQVFARRGVVASFRPLHGRTPFENWLITVTPASGHAD